MVTELEDFRPASATKKLSVFFGFRRLSLNAIVLKIIAWSDGVSLFEELYKMI